MANENSLKMKFSGVVVLHVPCTMFISQDGKTEIAIESELHVTPFLSCIHDSQNIPREEDMPGIRKLVTHLIINRAAAVFDPGVEHETMAPMTTEEIAKLLQGKALCTCQGHTSADCPVHGVH